MPTFNPFKDARRFTMSPIDRLAFDPETGGGYTDISWWAKLYFDIELFPWQHFLAHYPCKDKLVIAGIRVGKSKAASLILLNKAQYHPGARLLNTSISSEQAKIVYHNIMEVATQDRFKHWVDHVEKSPYPMIRLVNGSEIWFRSVGYEAELLRGFEFDVIHADEVAYITSEMAIKTLRGRLLGVNPLTGQPRLGEFLMSSSPKGKAGWLYERWKRGDARFPGSDPRRYLSLRVRTIDNPKLDQEALRELMADYSDRMIQQELEGEFLDSTSAEFELDQVIRCCQEADPVVKVLLNEIQEQREKQGSKRRSLKLELGLAEEIEHYELEPRPGRQYLASWDLGKKSTKAGRNATVGMVFDISELPWRMVAYRYEQGTGYIPAMGMIEQWQHKYSSRGTTCQTVMDATGKGDVLNEIIEIEQRFSVEGMVYNNTLKPNLITAGKIAIERELVRFPPIKRFIDQLSIYEQNDKDLPQDTVMAFVQAMYKAREITGVALPRPVVPSHSPLFTPATRNGGVPGLIVPYGTAPHLARLAASRLASRAQRSNRVYATRSGR